MKITLDRVRPVFLEIEKIRQSGIWNQHVIFSKGEVRQVIASSGSGKTSLINFLYGIRRDYEGEIRIGEKILLNFNIEEIAALRQRQLSIVFQDMKLFPNHTGMQNIMVKASLQQVHDEHRIIEMASRLGVQTKLDKKLETCSYGEQQRIAIIRALQQPFDFLIMDEPFSHLDEKNKKLAAELIMEEVAARKAGVILADLEPVPYFSRDLELFA